MLTVKYHLSHNSEGALSRQTDLLEGSGSDQGMAEGGSVPLLHASAS